MFMRENRKKNGATDPAAAGEAAAKSAAQGEKLDPNEALTEKPADWRFTPSMSSPAAINEAHYQGGISGSGPYSTSYEQHIHSVGGKPVNTDGDRGLKSR